MTWHFKDDDWTEYDDPDCNACGHLEHDDDECPEQVRLGGVLNPCGCGDSSEIP